jgi:hypothetical protein
VVNNVQTDGIYTLYGEVHNWWLQSGQGYTLNLWGDNGWADDSDNWTFHSYHIPYHPSDQMVFEVYLNPSGPGWVQTGYNVSQNFYLAHFASYVSGTHAIPTTNTCIFFENGNTTSGWWSGFTNPINIYSARNGTYNNQKAWTGQQIAILDNNVIWQPNTGEISGSLVNYGTAHFWLAYMLLGRN